MAAFVCCCRCLCLSDCVSYGWQVFVRVIVVFVEKNHREGEYCYKCVEHGKAKLCRIRQHNDVVCYDCVGVLNVGVCVCTIGSVVDITILHHFVCFG